MNKRSFRSVLALSLVALTLLSSCASKKASKTEEGNPSIPTESSGQPQTGSQGDKGSLSDPSASLSPSLPSGSQNGSDPTKPSVLPSHEPSNSPTVDPSDPVIVGTDLRFDKEALSIKKGSAFTVTGAVPEGTDPSSLTWYSSDESIAKVDGQGKVTTLKSGYAMIAAVTADGSYFDYLQLQVVSFDTDITALSFESNTTSLAIGATKTLSLSYEPQSAPFSNFVFRSENPEIVSVDENGRITAQKKGSATVTVIAPNGTTASVTVTVTDVINKVTSIRFEQQSVTVKAGESVSLQVTVLPENADNKALTFSCDNTSIATVDSDGTVYGIRGGTVTITATSHDGKVSADCTVSVSKPDDPIDNLDLTTAKVDDGQDGYNGGLRVKSSDEIMFSPNLDLFRALVSKDDYENYLGYIRFTALGDKEYVFRSVQIEPKVSKGDWVDFFLMGEDIDCGFCPTAEAVYRVEVALVNKKTNKVEFYSLIDAMKANKDLKDSPYYKPTENGGQPAGPTIPMCTLTYKAVSGGIVIGELSQTLKQGTQGTAIIAVPLPGYRFNNWSDGATDPIRQGDYAYQNDQISAYFINEKSAVIPTMHITTESGSPIRTKNYENATMVISGASDSKWNITATLQIRGRGNSSWNGSAGQSDYDSKNSYRIKLDEKEKLLGIGDSKNKDWVLNSNKFDLSGLRNKIIWEFAERMGTMTYVPDCTWVQLYINNEYRGMYMVTELIEAANDRVEIDETITKSEDKGYLIEIDFRGNYEDTPYFYIDGYGEDPQYHLHSAREFVIKNDGEVTDADLAYIKSYIEKCHKAFMNGDKAAIEELVDMDSLIDMYILEELGKDVDVGAASFFLHKKEGGKLYFTAPWDFDFGFGTYGPGVSTWDLVSRGNEGCDWFASLVEYEWFVKAVVARMDELRPEFEATIKAIEELSVELESAADMNANHWDLYGNHFHNYVSSSVSSNLYDYREHIDYLIYWTTDRYQNLYDFLSTYY